MKPWLRTVLIIIFAAIFVVSAWMLLDYLIESQKQQDTFDQLADLVQSYTPTEPIPTQPPENPDETQPPTEPPSPWGEVTNQKGETVQVLPQYAELYKINNDVVGWLTIEGTKINYPVMQTPGKKDYYLRRDFYGDYSSAGCLYAREECDINTPSENITIYGHNMRNGSMFAGLLKYRSGGKTFYEEHRYITFDTLTEHHVYEIFAVFDTTASIGEGFDYHNFIEGNKDDFEAFVYECLHLSYYDTGIVPEYGDKLITLSTCEYTQTNGRLVVVARQIS